MAYKSIVAENARRIMQDRGLKQCAVARKAGYTPEAFSSMMCGRKLISSEDVPRIAIALSVDFNALFADQK